MGRTKMGVAVDFELLLDAGRGDPPKESALWRRKLAPVPVSPAPRPPAPIPPLLPFQLLVYSLLRKSQ